MSMAKKNQLSGLNRMNAALLHSFYACILGGFLGSAGSIAAQPQAPVTAPPAFERDYQQTQSNAHKKYASDLDACAAKLVSAQCKRQARLDREQALHAAKLSRASAKNEASQVAQAHQSSHKSASKQSALKPQNLTHKKPMAAQTAPPKNAHTKGALSAQPNAQARRESVAKQAALQDTAAQRQTKANQKKAQREAKNQKRREAGYPVDAKPAP